MDYEKFKAEVLRLSGIDLTSYKERQMKRRIDSLIKKNGYKDYHEYVTALKKDKSIYEEFLSYLTINVSNFYRNPEQWALLEKDIIPYLLKQSGRSTLNIWSAACSTGDEPYSLVMLLSKFMPLNKIKITATDIDKQILDKARMGIYNKASLKDLPKEFVDKYFKSLGATSYQISEEVKKCVEFKQHNLLKDRYMQNMDLIVCRNVMIYFTEEAKLEIYKKFNAGLRKNCILFVGSTEQIINPHTLNFETYKPFFYSKM